MSIRSKIQSLITAANAETGESDTTLTDAVQTLVDGYGQGGSSLPTGMTHIGSGSFTFASRTSSTEKIYHGLDFTPKFVLLWMADSRLAYNDVFYSILTNQFVDNYGTTVSQRIIVYRSSSGATFSTTAGGPYITNEYFNINHGSYYYKAGSTYNWFAFD